MQNIMKKWDMQQKFDSSCILVALCVLGRDVNNPQPQQQFTLQSKTTFELEDNIFMSKNYDQNLEFSLKIFFCKISLPKALSE